MRLWEARLSEGLRCDKLIIVIENFGGGMESIRLVAIVFVYGILAMMVGAVVLLSISLYNYDWVRKLGRLPKQTKGGGLCRQQ